MEAAGVQSKSRQDAGATYEGESSSGILPANLKTTIAAKRVDAFSDWSQRRLY
jgi:hypothetical protein